MLPLLFAAFVFLAVGALTLFADAEWVDQEVLVDGNLVSSRKPEDIPAFNREMNKLFSQSRAKERRAS